MTPRPHRAFGVASASSFLNRSVASPSSVVDRDVIDASRIGNSLVTMAQG
jgi:hypothetical protein